MEELKKVWKDLVNKKIELINYNEFEKMYGASMLEMVASPNPYFSIRENVIRVNSWAKRFTNFESGKKDEELALILSDYIRNGYKTEYLDIIEEIKSEGTDDQRIYKTLGRKGYLYYKELPFFYREEPCNPIIVEDNYKRVDLRNLYTFSVDEEGTIEVDDAISINGNKVYIHVADVASSIKLYKNLSLLEKVMSLYLPEENFYLFSNKVIESFSLYKGDKKALTLVMEFDENLNLKSYNFIRTIISVKDRFDYKTFEKVLSIEPFKKLLTISRKFQLIRLNNGGYNINLPMKKFKIEDDSIHYELINLNSKSYTTISELMILYNYLASKLLRRLEFSAVYRNYEDKGQIQLDENDPLYYYKIMNLFKPTVLSSQPKAHTIMGLDVYAQFTSPLRRIYDIINQEQLHRALDNQEPVYHAEKIEEFIKVAVRIEKRKKNIQRDRLNFWTYVYLKKYHSERIISGVVSQANNKWSEIFFPKFLITEKVYYKGLEVGKKINCLIKNVDPFGNKMEIFIVK
ncbi:MAG: RNB domain-containing ribonuclease [candidate division WOR-3 bacterium]|nr:RNB domain-containing ribonuclease [candidate division WOR-3 bacterium]MCX7947044.1 RNB domain-containing ribonuclease [candidate division WOR-3 bacterium]MDW8149915.1 RNB domain-containing ribonuclease [candidate division WOR-3 bacterium]